VDFNETRDDRVAAAPAGPYANHCTSLQTDNHDSTSPLSFYRPDDLPDSQPTVSKLWTQSKKDENETITHRRDKALRDNQAVLVSIDVINVYKRFIEKQKTRFNVFYSLNVFIFNR